MTAHNVIALIKGFVGMDVHVLIWIENSQVPLTTLPGSILTFYVGVELGIAFSIEFNFYGFFFFSNVFPLRYTRQRIEIILFKKIVDLVPL